MVHGPMRVVYSEYKQILDTFSCFRCHFETYCEGLRNPIEICGSMIRWVI